MLKVTQNLNNSKKKAGFTIVEVLLALFILTSSIFVLSDVQIRAVRRVLRDREKIDRIFFVKKQWLEAFINPQDEEKPNKHMLTQPETSLQTVWRQLTRSLHQKPEKGEKKEPQPLRLITTEGTWQSGQFKETLTIVGVLYKPEAKDKKNS